jgi:hypothetical protein
MILQHWYQALSSLSYNKRLGERKRFLLKHHAAIELRRARRYRQRVLEGVTGFKIRGYAWRERCGGQS